MHKIILSILQSTCTKSNRETTMQHHAVIWQAHSFNHSNHYTALPIYTPTPMISSNTHSSE